MSQTHSRPFFGWRVVAAAFIVAMFGWGIGFYDPPVYRRRRDREPAGATSPVRIAARHAGRRDRAGVGVIGWPLASTPWQLYAATLLTGAGWPALGAAAINAIVSP